jgi:MFS family permease
VVGDSVQFSALVTEKADAEYIGSALTLQMASGFFLSGLTIWLIPAIRDLVGWQWAFAVLAPGPACGILAMWRSLRLRRRFPPRLSSHEGTPHDRYAGQKTA